MEFVHEGRKTREKKPRWTLNSQSLSVIFMQEKDITQNSTVEIESWLSHIANECWIYKSPRQRAYDWLY